ncbi:MAG: hypothetical protein WCO58_01590 [bacterium]
MNIVHTLPPFMGEGSIGPHVSPLHAFLCGARYGHDLQFDKEFGEMTAAALKMWQEDNRLENDSCFGPESRKWAKSEYGFDFEAICKTIQGETTFCDPLHQEESVIYKNAE